jgi:hypothetical protein
MEGDPGNTQLRREKKDGLRKHCVDERGGGWPWDAGRERVRRMPLDIQLR